MTNRTGHLTGLIMVISGIALLMVNALDYVMHWNQLDSSISAIGLMLVVIGGGLLRRTKEGLQGQIKK